MRYCFSDFSMIWVSFQCKLLNPDLKPLTFSRRRPISYRNQSIDLLCKSMDEFLCNKDIWGIIRVASRLKMVAFKRGCPKKISPKMRKRNRKLLFSDKFLQVNNELPGWIQTELNIDLVSTYRMSFY